MSIPFYKTITCRPNNKYVITTILLHINMKIKPLMHVVHQKINCVYLPIATLYIQYLVLYLFLHACELLNWIGYIFNIRYERSHLYFRKLRNSMLNYNKQCDPSIIYREWFKWFLYIKTILETFVIYSMFLYIIFI